MNHEVEQHGFAIVPRAIEADEQRELLATLGPVSGDGRRGLLALPVVAELAASLAAPRFQPLHEHTASSRVAHRVCGVHFTQRTRME